MRFSLNFKSAASPEKDTMSGKGWRGSPRGGASSSDGGSAIGVSLGPGEGVGMADLLS